MLSSERFTQRLRAGIDQRPDLDARTVAAKVGRHETTVGKWLKGTLQPNLDDLARLAEVLGVTVDWLLGHEVAKPTAARPVVARAGLSTEDRTFSLGLLAEIRGIAGKLADYVEARGVTVPLPKRKGSLGR